MFEDSDEEYDEDGERMSYSDDGSCNRWDRRNRDSSSEESYVSDYFFMDSDSEEMKKVLVKTQRNKHITKKFEYWEFLPSELKEMVVDKLDLGTWMNLMVCYRESREYNEFPYFSLEIQRFSFFSDIVTEESKEREHIRIRVDNETQRMMLKIKERDGDCKLSWNWDNSKVGFVNIKNCGYLKIAERVMKKLITPDCTSFKIIVEKNKTDPFAQSVSKWPFFYTFLKKFIGFEDDGKAFVDEQFFVDTILERMRKPAPERDSDAHNMWHRRMNCVLGLPDLDAKKVVDLIYEVVPLIMADHEKRKLAEKKFVAFAHERFIVLKESENSIKIDGPLMDYYHCGW